MPWISLHIPSSSHCKHGLTQPQQQRTAPQIQLIRLFLYHPKCVCRRQWGRIKGGKNNIVSRLTITETGRKRSPTPSLLISSACSHAVGKSWCSIFNLLSAQRTLQRSEHQCRIDAAEVSQFSSPAVFCTHRPEGHQMVYVCLLHQKIKKVHLRISGEHTQSLDTNSTKQQHRWFKDLTTEHGGLIFFREKAV